VSNHRERQGEHWYNLAIGLGLLADVHVSSGQLRKACAASEEGLKSAEQTGDPGAMADLLSVHAYVAGLCGEADEATRLFGESLNWQQRREASNVYQNQRLYGGRGVCQEMLLLRMGRYVDAKDLAEVNNATCESAWGDRNCHSAACRLIIAESIRTETTPTTHMLGDDGKLLLDYEAIPKGQIIFGDGTDYESHVRQVSPRERAAALLDAVLDWAISRDIQELACRAHLACAKLEIGLPWEEPGPLISADAMARIDASLSEGLRIARECGFGLLHIDLLVLRGYSRLIRGDAPGATEDA
jgi:hypothetical protein